MRIALDLLAVALRLPSRLALLLSEASGGLVTEAGIPIVLE